MYLIDCNSIVEEPPAASSTTKMLVTDYQTTDHHIKQDLQS